MPAFPDGLTSREVLDLAVRIQRECPTRSTGMNCCNTSGCRNYGIESPTELSGGERQRLAVARCLVVDASLILLDEPTAQLDRRNAQRVIDLLTSSARRAIVICATHDAELIGQADAVYSLDTVRRQVVVDD